MALEKAILKGKKKTAPKVSRSWLWRCTLRRLSEVGMTYITMTASTSVSIAVILNRKKTNMNT